ncbi:MAG: hypothetical protein AAFQ94_27955 [Bacteroidota bacterium]
MMKKDSICIQYPSSRYPLNTIVQLSIELIDSEEVIIKFVDISENFIEENKVKFLAGIRFGIHYALDSIKKSFPATKAVRAIITKIPERLDVTNESVAYTSCMSIFKAFDFYPAHPPFVVVKNDRKYFIFPETQKVPPMGRDTIENNDNEEYRAKRLANFIKIYKNIHELCCSEI